MKPLTATGARSALLRILVAARAGDHCVVNSPDESRHRCSCDPAFVVSKLTDRSYRASGKEEPDPDHVLCQPHWPRGRPGGPARRLRAIPTTPDGCRRSATMWCCGHRATRSRSYWVARTGFVLSSSGHIAGIVNLPNPKAKHWVNDSLSADPHDMESERAISGRHLVAGLDCVDRRAGGEMIPAPDDLRGDDYPPIENAPGSYVRATA
jgi:hypothetical protein